MYFDLESHLLCLDHRYDCPDLCSCVFSATSLQKLHRETLLPQHQMSHMHHRGPPDAAAVQHQVGVVVLLRACSTTGTDEDVLSSSRLCRPDRQLQDIVYKMVPLLEESKNRTRCLISLRFIYTTCGFLSSSSSSVSLPQMNDNE